MNGNDVALPGKASEGAAGVSDSIRILLGYGRFSIQIPVTFRVSATVHFAGPHSRRQEPLIPSCCHQHFARRQIWFGAFLEAAARVRPSLMAALAGS